MTNASHSSSQSALHTSTTARELQAITAKRVALEQLIDIGVGIQVHQRALEELSVIARPSQQIPPRMAQLIVQFEERFRQAEDGELLRRLEAVERVTTQTLEAVVALVRVEAVALRDGEAGELSIDAFLGAINDFKRRTQSALALRYMLKKRGLTLPAFQLPFPQEAIAEKIVVLREKEQRCLTRIRGEIHAIIADTERWLAMDSFPQRMKEEIAQVREAMRANLAHLDRGGSIAAIPHKFEVVNLDEPAPESDPVPSAAGAQGTLTHSTAPPPKTSRAGRPAASSVPSAPAAPAGAETDPGGASKKRSFLWLLMKWLSTPWAVSWKEIKDRYRGKS